MKHKSICGSGKAREKAVDAAKPCEEMRHFRAFECLPSWESQDLLSSLLFCFNHLSLPSEICSS